MNFGKFAVLCLFCFLLSGLFLTSTLYADEGFPGRELYPNVNTISKVDLYEKIKNDAVVVVDVRSTYEYNTLKILNAKHISAASKGFGKKLQELRATTPKDIIFYCNGRTCYKSYKAGIKALQYNVKNCYTYDAGVFEWANQYPELSELLGESPVKKANIISKDDFKSRLITPADFDNYAANTQSIIVDVRDREQRRGGGGLFMFRDKHVDLDNTRKLDKIIQKAMDENVSVLFYDQKGKQVRWLQYYLEKQGLQDYYFMRGGAGAYYEKIRKEQS